MASSTLHISTLMMLAQVLVHSLKYAFVVPLFTSKPVGTATFNGKSSGSFNEFLLYPVGRQQDGPPMWAWSRSRFPPVKRVFVLPLRLVWRGGVCVSVCVRGGGGCQAPQYFQTILAMNAQTGLFSWSWNPVIRSAICCVIKCCVYLFSCEVYLRISSRLSFYFPENVVVSASPCSETSPRPSVYDVTFFTLSQRSLFRRKRGSVSVTFTVPGEVLGSFQGRSAPLGLVTDCQLRPPNTPPEGTEISHSESCTDLGCRCGGCRRI